MRKRALIYMIMAGTLALSGCRATSQNPDANAAAVEQNTAQDGQNENNDGNGAPDKNGAPDGKEAPGGKGGPDGNGVPGAGQSAPESYDAVDEITSDTSESGKTYTSTRTDENAILVSDGATLTLKNFKLNRTSGGIHVASGGTLHADNLTVETSGESSAAIRSDRGGGTMTVNGGTYTSNGSGSPAVYCTADITINDATLTATGAEAVCIEGLNSLKLTDCDLSGNIPDNEQNDCDWTVILYQSMSGDSEVGNSTFDMTGGSLTSKNGGMFYTTNTESTFSLNNVKMTYSDSNDFFLKCTGNANKRGWGKSGSNGADCIFTATEQDMKGDIIWDSISTLEFTMKSGSSLTGAIVDDETNAGNGGDGSANVTIDKTSTWTVTGDSRVSKLVCSGTIVDNQGKNVTIKKSDGTVIKKGSSCYTITVDSYSAS